MGAGSLLSMPWMTTVMVCVGVWVCAPVSDGAPRGCFEAAADVVTHHSDLTRASSIAFRCHLCLQCE